MAVWSILVIPTILLFGHLGLVAWGLAAVVFVVGIVIKNGVESLIEQWKDFSKKNPPDDVRIMNKLRGTEE
jgi:hypothetical protein